MHRRMTGLALVVLSVAGLTACGSSDSGDAKGTSDSGGKTTEVTVGVIPIVDVAPLYLGQKQGFFEKRGIRLKTVTAQGGAAIIPGVVSGQFQFGFSNTTSLMLAQTKGVPIKAVANGAASNGKVGADVTAVLVKKDSPAKSAKDLAGHTVAVNTLQNIGDTTVRETVRKAGGDPSKVKFVEIPFDQMPAALDDGRVDAAWMGEPSQTIAKGKGARVIASPFAETDPALTVAAYFTSTKIAQQNPALVKKFTEAMNESLEYASAHPDEARSTLTTYTKISGDVLDKLILPSWTTAVNRASLEKLAELGRQDGVFGDKKPDIGALFS
ncbi:ABC transporter substrate-binding protein [Streptomyces acidiscabies]|uniref:ABC transporter substrate-binding protein n=1 Tax=Streptomyces acidiscabies TaxID=42234 RepID=A0A0L0KI86_9ACTN|nr:ABC transporter substrate-binding protein [Streptomyces acidiscabies]MBP5942073.1 nitrate ABC transporter substrate-binding protein [Streptomyces sp. LBUM 1476]KND37279.1 nitrate ABC transporter substrate-binding protein [Streptomyces acidiscabies]MBZ3913564.1 ABC transporter substrate-binding protein [Streptomyces acidiscabies]MDX2963402.1 ABC transporter substrate-binding protein [Streptomyces acidiscabies]MDX3023136.1 ABC transporter substrate-binding protein [Streptomyces acidiscabies]